MFAMQSVPAILGTLVFLAATTSAQDSPTLSGYLPDGITYDASFPKPASVLGWEVGTWHARHDQIVRWFEVAAASSERVSLESYGATHEQRSLLLATVTSPANHARIEDIRKAHRAAVLNGDDSYSGPAVVWMGAGVHGDEPSGSNASLLLLYHLAAAEGDAIEAFLENTIVLIDPCVNPDGTARFAQWANQHKGRNLVGDPSNRDHTQAWPGGRTNHYWFDLNRDWLLLTHPESQGRVERFHAWMPQVLTDYHEMGSGSTYFFQPGIPTRRNPFTPEENVELTKRIAAVHADALDEIGSLYYTEESFDDFYYGKGSTYPDIHGAVGILFEQASARGHKVENDHGGLDFPFTIRNQFVTALSTLAAVDRMRDDLSDYQRRFYRDALAESADHPVKAYVFGEDADPLRTFEMVRILRGHDIAVHRLAQEVQSKAGLDFDPDSAYVVRLDQPQHRLIRALFETRTSWDDNTFYDVSTWTLPLCFDMATLALEADAFDDGLVGAPVGDAGARLGEVHSDANPVAWAFRWEHANAPRALALLLAADVRARVATKPFAALNADPDRFLEFGLGTIVVPTGIQDVDPTELRALVEEIANLGVDIWAIDSGFTQEGADLGSPSQQPIESPELLMLVGRGTSNYEVGEIWHELDTRVDMPVTMVERRSFERLQLERYTHILLVSGATAGWGDDEVLKLKTWVSAGGIVIAQKSSAVWAAETLMTNADDEDDHQAHADESEEHTEEHTEDGEEEPEDVAEPKAPTYADYEDLRDQQRVAGTIFETTLDRTHPLAFGFTRDRLPVFRNSTTVLPEAKDPFATPVRYTDSPLLSGFASDDNIAKFAGTPAVRAQRIGAGTVICMIDDPNFRGVWHGTRRLFANAVFFGGAIKRTGPLDTDEEAGAVEVEDQHGHH
jgi:hypothetical protein